MKITFTFLFFCIYSFYFATNQSEIQQKFDSCFEQVKKYRDQGKEKQMLTSGQAAIKIANSLSDDAGKAKVYIALGNFYYDINESSSVAYDYYYKAYHAYSNKKDSLKMAKTFLRLAILEKNTRSYLRSKESCFLALELLEKSPNDFLESIYNNLGIVYGELQDLKSSIFYHKKALLIRIRDAEKELVIQSYNNIAVAYMKNGNLDEAAVYFKKGLSYPENILKKYPEEYGRLLDNYSYLQFLQGKKEIEKGLFKALSIRENCGHVAGILSSYLHLASYYQGMKNLNRSNFYGLLTYKKAKQTKNYRDVLSSLILLQTNSEEEKAYKKALEYGHEYSQLVDSLHKEELKIGEKFADIRYAASQKEKENKNLRQENKKQQILTEKRKKYLYIAIGIFGVIALAGLGYIQYSRMEQKQKEQKAENEIISLLFERQEASEKAKSLEQKRIFHDLHDSIAGKLSGLMLKLDTIAVSSPVEIKKKLDPAVDHLDAIIRELSNIVHDMNEHQITHASSYPILIEETAKSQLPEKIKFSFTIDDSIDWDTISNRIKLEFYYIIQQGVRNIYEHSEASEASVKIRSEESFVFLTISDNGKGIHAQLPIKGMGIPGMKKRTEGLGGKLELQSRVDKGTTITIKIPL